MTSEMEYRTLQAINRIRKAIQLVGIQKKNSSRAPISAVPRKIFFLRCGKSASVPRTGPIRATRTVAILAPYDHQLRYSVSLRPPEVAR